MQDFEEIFSNIIDGKISASDAKKILLQLNEKPFSSDCFIGAVRALKKNMKTINAPENSIDLCGTGGDGLNTLNISTATCFVVAAGGVFVAKHGNKAISSKSGSADIFHELKIPIFQDEKLAEEQLIKNKLCFLFAPFFHESLKNIASIRREIAQEFGVPTIFNYLGPLLNPANTKLQLIGTSKKSTMLPILEALKYNSAKRVYIVHGFDKMDEITICDNSYLLSLEDNKITEEIIDPEKYGLKKVSHEAIIGNTPEYNAKKLLELLSGEKSSYRDIVLLNAAFVFKLSGVVTKIEDGIEMSKSLIDQGLAMSVYKKISLK